MKTFKTIAYFCIIIVVWFACCGIVVGSGSAVFNVARSIACVIQGVVFSDTYDTATPQGSDDPAEADDRMREIKSAVQERLNVEHRFALTGTEVSAANTGEHTDVTVDSIVSAGNITLSAGADLIGSATSDINIGSGNFSVSGASGNVGIVGSLNPTSFLTTKGGFIDDDTMATASATTVGSTESIKAYVDNQNTAQASSLIKAWISFDGDTGAKNGTGFNITSVVRTGVGLYTITWATDFADDDYAIAGFCADAGNSAGVVSNKSSDTPLAAGTTLIQTNNIGDASLKDYNLVTVIAIGDQ